MIGGENRDQHDDGLPRDENW